MLAIGAWSSSSTTTWIPTYIRRQYDRPAAEVGLVTGLLNAFGGTIGGISSGWFADKFIHKTHRIRVLICLFCVVGSTPFNLAALYTNKIEFAYAFLFFGSALSGVGTAQSPGIVADNVPKENRATGVQFYNFVIILTSYAMSSYAIGKISDHFINMGQSGAQGLRNGLLFSNIFAAFALVFYLLAFFAMGKEKKRKGSRI